MEKRRILVVDDSRILRARLKEDLARAGALVRTAESAHDALTLLPEWQADLVVSGLRWEGGGMALCAWIRGAPRPPAFMMLSPEVDVLATGEAGGVGAPPMPGSIVPATLSAAVCCANPASGTLARTAIDTKRDVGHVEDFHGLLGCGPEMCGLRLRLKKAASTDAPVLLTGASGSGKELAARAIHEEGARRHRPFVAVNCGGIPESLWESEFFGYKAGAFSGAARDQDGLFAAAHGGTLFLDEVGEMPLAGQAKLLRVLEGGWIRPVGALRERRVDVRIVAATNRDLSQAVEQGRFRQDLLFRIDVLGVSLPGLAGRFDDIAVLARHFLQECRREAGGPTLRFRPDALRALQHYAFPGNARELRNIVKSAAVFARDAEIAFEDLPARVRRQYGGKDDGRRRGARDDGSTTGDLVTLEEWKQAYVRDVLRRVGGNKRAAARILGIERRTLYRWLTED